MAEKVEKKNTKKGEEKRDPKKEREDKLAEKNRVKLLLWSTVQLKALYTKLHGKTFKANDKQHLAKKLGRDLASSGMKAGDPPDEAAAKAPEVNLEADEARSLLKSVQVNWDEVDSLKEERREACAEIRGEIAVAREKIKKQLEKSMKADKDGDGDAARKALRQIDAQWRLINRRDKDLANTRKEYTERINAANGRIRDVLSNMRQQTLPFWNPDEDGSVKGKPKEKKAAPAKSSKKNTAKKDNGTTPPKPAAAKKKSSKKATKKTAAPSSTTTTDAPTPPAA